MLIITHMSIHHLFDHYIDRMNEIRTLSTPSLEGIDDANAYSVRLRENFTKIGALASENREFLDNALFPLLYSERKLSAEEIKELDEFCDHLLNVTELENLDHAILLEVADRLLKDAQANGDLVKQIRYMDIWMSTLYTLMNITDRITEYPEIAMEYRKKGLELGDYFLSLREHDRFAAIPDEESRELVLTNSRFLTVFYENLTGYPENNRRELALMSDSLALCDDPFYPPLVPDFDWDYFRFRLLGYYAVCTDYNNAKEFDKEQLSLICDKTEELWSLWHTDPDRYKEFDEERYLKFLLVRNRYLAGRSDIRHYRKELLALYETRIRNNYEMTGICENVLIPAEIMCILENRRINEAEKMLIGDLYTDVVNHTFQLPNSGILSYLLEFLSHFIQHFLEIPEGIQFEEMMLDLLAALHPPTYVHSRMVAQFTACLCGHLIDMRPDLFVGMPDCQTEEDVAKNRGELIHFSYHAALCHDAGKLFIIDTVFVYGRKLQDMEFDLIKTHPKMGAAILSRYPSTAAYAEVALGHHKWYDNSRGYPEEFDTSKSRLKTIIDLVLCADCLDAATDTIGRSYNRGKTMDDFIGELKEGSGTRYAPWLLDLVSREEVKKDLSFLLQVSRERNYRNTYHLLRGVYEESTIDS